MQELLLCLCCVTCYLVLLSCIVQLQFRCYFRTVKRQGHSVQIQCHHLEFIRTYTACLNTAQICMHKAKSHWQITSMSEIYSVKSVFDFSMLIIQHLLSGNRECESHTVTCACGQNLVQGSDIYIKICNTAITVVHIMADEGQKMRLVLRKSTDSALVQFCYIQCNYSVKCLQLYHWQLYSFYHIVGCAYLY